MSSRRAVLASVAVAASLGTLACGDKSVDSTGPEFKGGPPPTTGLSCSFNTMKNDVDLYFAVADRPDVQLNVSSMKTLYGSKGSAEATNKGFDILAQIATAHDAMTTSTALGSAAAGSNLANDVIACMVVSPQPTAIINLAGALGAGAFEVRGGTGDGDARIVTLDKQSGIAKPDGGAFADLSSERLLFYGERIETFAATSRLSEVAYSWNTVPERHTFNALARAGVCIAQDNKDRIQEVSGSTNRLLATVDFVALNSELGLTCPTLQGRVPNTLFGRMVQFARNAFLPQEAYAGQQGGGTGGLLGGLSDLGVIDVGNASFVMARVKDATTTTPVSVTVTLKSQSGLAMPGESVSLAVAGNSGSFTPISPTAKTNEQGVITFSVILDKAGGYTLGATVDYGSGPVMVISNLFHIKK